MRKFSSSSKDNSRFLTGIFSLLCVIGASAQVMSLQETRRLFEKPDSLMTWTSDPLSGGPVNVLEDSTTAVENILKSLMQSDFKSVRHDTLQESLVLDELACYAIHRWNENAYAKQQDMRRIQRRLYRVFYASNCRFGMLSVFSFTVPLVQAPPHFYYDRKGEDGGFNLYKGKRKPRPTKEEPEPTVTPLKLLTEQELAAAIERKLRKVACSKELKSGRVSYAGYAVIPDRSTFFHSRRTPRVRVVILLGSKRLQLIRKRNTPPPGPE